MTYACVLFDLDGTLVDGRAGIVGAMRHALEQMGRPWPDTDLGGLIGPPLQEVFAESLAVPAEDVDTAVRVFRERYSATGLYEAHVFEGIAALLADIDGTLGVATSKPHVYAERVLTHFGLRRHFSAVAGPELDGTRRRKPEVIAHALDLLGNPDRRQVIMIGDRRYDVEGARAMGVTSVSVGWGFGSADELHAAAADHHAPDVADLRRILLGSG